MGNDSGSKEPGFQKQKYTVKDIEGRGKYSDGQQNNIDRRPGKGPLMEHEWKGPLTEKEWKNVCMWLSHGSVGVDSLTGDADHNALIVAAAIFCNRVNMILIKEDRNEDPLLCLDSDITRADPRVKELIPEVIARGKIYHWPSVARKERIRYVINLLVNTHNFPEKGTGAAGLVGNLMVESDVLPCKVEGNKSDTPLTGKDFAGKKKDFTPEEVMNREQDQSGPLKPGVGLAQWTSDNRRSGLFRHQYNGRSIGACILFNMDAQVDYLVHELQRSYRNVFEKITDPNITVDDATDEVLYNFEIPKSILADKKDAQGNVILDSKGNPKKNGKLPRNNPTVQERFKDRRKRAAEAMEMYKPS